MHQAASHTDQCGPINAQAENADLHSSSQEYADRFGGTTGAWMLSIQERALVRMLPKEASSVLDVGGGHGQTALPLQRDGRSVTILGSSLGCSQRLREYIDSGSISFRTGNLIELPFNDTSFDAVISFRLMSHCTQWRTLIAEMCRVAESTVIFDYPIWCSANLLTPLLFRIKRRIEGNTRSYRIFTTRELTKEFKAHGFECSALYKQFFFPMGLHRAIKSQRASAVLELIPRMLGLTRLFGSPVVICFTRRRDGR
jgi:ubiquinone/menaquinone biosynthesis C-methylase UbiE